MKEDEIYLGDAVYARRTPYREIELYTSNGAVTTNQITLDTTVVKNLLNWLKESDSE